jgi:hypothetical protein
MERGDFLACLRHAVAARDKPRRTASPVHVEFLAPLARHPLRAQRRAHATGPIAFWKPAFRVPRYPCRRLGREIGTPRVLLSAAS